MEQRRFEDATAEEAAAILAAIAAFLAAEATPDSSAEPGRISRWSRAGRLEAQRRPEPVAGLLRGWRG